MKRALPLCLVYLASGTLVVAPGWTRAGDATAPAPATVWPAGPLELVMAFPAPVEPQWSRTLVGKAIAYFDHDRGAPGGPAAAAPLGSLRIAGVRLADQGRTLLLATDPHPRIARYELILGPKREPAKVVSYDLSGVEADWSSSKDDAGAEPAWKGWWPDLDLDATRRLTRGSALHERALALLEQPGRLSLSTLLSLPPGENMVLIEASGALSEVTLGDEQPVVDPRPGPNGMYRVILSGRSLGVPLYLSLNVETGRRGRPLAIHASRRGARASHCKRSSGRNSLFRGHQSRQLRRLHRNYQCPILPAAMCSVARRSSTAIRRGARNATRFAGEGELSARTSPRSAARARSMFTAASPPRAQRSHRNTCPTRSRPVTAGFMRDSFEPKALTPSWSWTRTPRRQLSGAMRSTRFARVERRSCRLVWPADWANPVSAT